MGILSTIRGMFVGKAATEGAYRAGPYLVDGGWLPDGAAWNFWQMGQGVQSFGDGSAMVEACVSAYAQTIAMCPGDHWRKLPNGGRERVTNSALSRLMKKPNSYQSISDFMLNLARRLYVYGEAFAFVERNARNEVDEIHLMRFGTAMVAEDGSIFYNLWGNEVVERMVDLSGPVPSRYVLHVRLHTPRHVLKGESPIVATVLERAMAGAALNQQVNYYLNQSKPSWLLETDQILNREQSTELRRSWEAQTTGENSGRTPILTAGLKARAAPTTAADASLAEMLKMTDQSIALAFRIPLQILGLGGTPFASTEALMASWKASGLGFALNHIEEAFGLLFELKGQPDEYLELDTEALMRSAFKDRIEGLARAVITGIYSPDEARAKEDLPAVPNGAGAEPRVQQQVVPLSYGVDMKPPEATPAAPAAPPAEDPPAAEDPGDNADAQRFAPDDILQRVRGYAGLH